MHFKRMGAAALLFATVMGVWAAPARETAGERDSVHGSVAASDEAGHQAAADVADLNGAIFVHCAAGMRKPIERLAADFEDRTGVAVGLSYAGTNKLLGQIRLTEQGDIYIAGDADYIQMAAEEGIVARSETVCYFVPVIMVAKGNPLDIRTLHDCLEESVRIGQADPKAAAIGRLTPELLALHEIDFDRQWSRNISLVTGTVNELGVAIRLGTLDAALVWSSIALNYAEDAEFIELDPSRNVIPEVGAAVLTYAENPDAADAFLTFLVSAQAKAALQQDGYVTDNPLGE